MGPRSGEPRAAAGALGPGAPRTRSVPRTRSAPRTRGAPHLLSHGRRCLRGGSPALPGSPPDRGSVPGAAHGALWRGTRGSAAAAPLEPWALLGVRRRLGLLGCAEQNQLPAVNLCDGHCPPLERCPCSFGECTTGLPTARG